MAARYKADIPFLLVYVREAHPTDGAQAPQNIRDGVLLSSAKTQAEKNGYADVCVIKLDIHFPALVDKMDNHVELAYAGWPDRLYLIGKDGRVVYKSAPGPAGFIASELETAIRKTLGRTGPFVTPAVRTCFSSSPYSLLWESAASISPTSASPSAGEKCLSRVRISVVSR